LAAVAFMRCIGIIAAALVGFVSSVSAATIYSINWLSDPQPCASVLESPLGGPIISKYYASCNFEGMPVSICPGMSGGPNLQQPWHARAEISIVGYQLSVILPDPTTKAIVEVGSSRPKNDGADIFATLSATGTTTDQQWFPSGLSIPQGGDGAHIDVYASCGGAGTFAVLLTIFYTVRQ
jgi:hypothetical protein